MAKALVIGRGIAGMATAIALRQAGLDAAIYEARTAGAEGRGAFLTIMANGLDALRAIDADAPVLEHSFASRDVRMRTGQDRGLGVLTIPVPGPQRGPRTMRRADLYRVLSEEVRRRGVPVEHGKRLAHAEQDAAGRVTASFADGTRAEGDLLVGADGVHSTTRTLIDRGAPAPAYTGWNIVFGAVRQVPAASSRDASYYMYFGRRASCGHTVSPDGETWWFANVPCAEGALAEAPPGQLRGQLARLFTGDRIPTVAAILATGDEQITATACYQLRSVPVWSRAGMTLAGDALHVASPVTTQGASMAIEDAVILAKCLRDLPDTGSAFDAYERLRRARVERVVASGVRNLGPRLPKPVKRLLRDLAVARRARNPGVDWLHLHHIDWDRDTATDLAAAGG
ncbi:MAG TPA: FAD-dependent monooxygenase [Streptosporangiaceae bacterium]|jgi:2-polyprenyl-6-methoxyphenol hydroxylase-like FAD-dependent oxidoreductase